MSTDKLNELEGKLRQFQGELARLKKQRPKLQGDFDIQFEHLRTVRRDMTNYSVEKEEEAMAACRHTTGLMHDNTEALSDLHAQIKQVEESECFV